MLEYIDSHAHYEDPRFDADRDALLNKLHENGVKAIINIGSTVEYSRAGLELAGKYPFVYATVGIHPGDVEEAPANYLEELSDMAADEKTVGIGEIGLDYHYDGYDRKKQIKFFDEQLDLAGRLGLPVVIHSRGASEDTMNVLGARGKINGVMHCFSGSAQTAGRALKLGMHISFTGVLTFKNARKALEALEAVPLDRLLLETDCPYMAPEPYRGKRCDSGMILSIIETAAKIKGVSPELIAKATAENTLRLFNKMRT